MSAKSNKIVKLGESQNATQAVDKSRRSFARLGVAAPVIMTLASKPVFAVQGLSHMQSIAPSNGGGHCFSGGMSPGYFSNPRKYPFNGITGDITGNKKLPASYSGTTVSVVFGTHLYPSGAGNLTLIGIMNSQEGDPYPLISGGDDPFFRAIQGLLNCKHLGSAYFMTETQFWAMYDGTMSVPAPYASLKDLIKLNEDKDLNCTGEA